MTALGRTRALIANAARAIETRPYRPTRTQRAPHPSPSFVSFYTVADQARRQPVQFLVFDDSDAAARTSA